MLTIDSHPSVGEGALEREAIASLRVNRIDPKLLYVTPRQTELWRQVFRRHSPIQGNPEFARIYRDAFSQIVRQLSAKKVRLVGLGCGTGLKELDLFSHLKASGREAIFSAVDVSRDLVVESAQKLLAAGSGHERSLVCDLAETEFLAGWLSRGVRALPRVITFFGLVPNLAPSTVIKLFRAVLRPGGVLLASAHLAPVGDDRDLADAMRLVLPQYDNQETLAWLTAALEEWNLQDLVDAPQMKIEEIEGVPAFVGTARWKASEPFERWGHGFAPKEAEPLELFHSLRYTPSLFEELLRREGFEMERLAITSCREEGIWSVCRGDP